jgi:hypothetical protein
MQNSTFFGPNKTPNSTSSSYEEMLFKVKKVEEHNCKVDLNNLALSQQYS